jgi:hypothetical protein
MITGSADGNGRFRTWLENSYQPSAISLQLEIKTKIDCSNLSMDADPNL